MNAPRAVLFGDTIGLPRLLRHVPAGAVRGLVRASIREEQTEELMALATTYGVPLLVQPRADDPSYPSFVGAVRDLAPDVILVDSYAMLLREDVLTLASGRAFNLHGALLPTYRGPNPIQWALIHGARETGVTLHHMSAEFDTGDIVAQRHVPIAFTDTWRDVAERLEEASEQLLAAELGAVLSGNAPRRAQGEAGASRYPRRGPEDGRIDWSWTVRRIHDLVRALVAPLPGAFYEAGGERVVVDRYLTVGTVAALKAEVGGARFAPLRPDGTASDDAVGLGPVRLCQLDWEAGTAVVAPNRDATPEEVRAAADFARDQLALEPVSDPGRR